MIYFYLILYSVIIYIMLSLSIYNAHYDLKKCANN